MTTFPLAICRGVAASMLAFAIALPAAAQESTQSQGTYSGYDSNHKSLEGGDSVTEDLALDDMDAGSVLSFPKIERFFDPYFAWKKRLNENTGLKLQLSYQTLYQTTSDDVPYSDAFAGRAQIQGSWSLIDRGGANEGKLTFRIEDRYRINSEIPPSKFGFQFGSVAPSGTGFSDFGLALTELAWRQSLMDGKFKFVIGKISAISWYNVHALSSSMRGFQNTALQSSLSKPAPGRGLGMGFGYEITPNWVVVAGIHDANASTPDNPFDTIGEGEFYRSVEIRYLPTTPDRWRYDQVRLQFWQQDALSDSDTPSSYGATLTASKLFGDRYFLFGFGGISDGDASLFDADLAGGFGIAFDTKHRTARDVLGFGLGWGHPSDDRLRDQYTSELFYRLQLVKHVALTPSVQYVRKPAADPDRDDALLFGLRMRVSF